MAQQIGPQRRQAPGQRAAPIVRHQHVHRRAGGLDRGTDIGYQVARAVGGDIRRSRRTGKAAQIGRQALHLRPKLRHHRLPYKGRFGKAVQQHHPGRTFSCSRSTAGKALQRHTVGQYKGSCGQRAHRGRVHACSTSATPPRPCRDRAENNVTLTSDSSLAISDSAAWVLASA